MSEIVQLTAADINTTVNHEPRIEDLRLAEALGFADKHMIRRLIERHRASLETFGEVFASGGKRPSGEFPSHDGNPKRRGRPGRTFYLNRKQALFITAKSDTERAAHVTVEMVEVFDAVMRGDHAEAAKIVSVAAHKRRYTPAGQSVEALRKEVDELRAAIAEMKALPAPKEKIPGPFEPGSDVLKDLILAVYSAKQRVKLDGWTDFGEALTDVLADLRATRDGRRPSGRKIYDWVDRRTGYAPPDRAGDRSRVN